MLMEALAVIQQRFYADFPAHPDEVAPRRGWRLEMRGRTLEMRGRRLEMRGRTLEMIS
jgi:hypothetical protein